MIRSTFKYCLRLSFLLTLVTSFQGLHFEKTERSSFIIDLDRSMIDLDGER